MQPYTPNGVPEPQQLPLSAIPDRHTRIEWEHFRGFGWTDERIAIRLGFHPETPQKWAERHPSHVRPTRGAYGYERCPVCCQQVPAHNTYHAHPDTSGGRCPMSGQPAQVVA